MTPSPGIPELLREALANARQNWWLFVDWLAVVEWKKLAVLWVLVLIGFGLLHTPEPGVWFMLISGGIKVMGGGKRKAELDAAAADRKAGVANLERRLTEAQMATLQAQVEPHFLFNTLALIGQLIETDQAEAARVHAHLIDYLRASLPQMRAAGSATLGKQVELSRAYLAIMQARMKERLKVQFRVPDFLCSAPFPPLMLQTLIENAIKHGLEPSIAGGRIEVSARVEEATLVVDVFDNGVGFAPLSNEGLGLANIHERLQLLFGRDAELVIESPPNGGTRASIRMPYQMLESV
jgi:hypothetical protein